MYKLCIHYDCGLMLFHICSSPPGAKLAHQMTPGTPKLVIRRLYYSVQAAGYENNTKQQGQYHLSFTPLQ